MVGYTYFQRKTYDVNRMNNDTTVKVLDQQPALQIIRSVIEPASRDSIEDNTNTNSNNKLNTNAVKMHYKLLIFEPVNSSLLMYATPLFVKFLAHQPTIQIGPNTIESALRDSREDDTHTESNSKLNTNKVRAHYT